MKMKRRYARLLAVAMIVMLASGCGGNMPSSEDTASTSEPQATQSTHANEAEITPKTDSTADSSLEVAPKKTYTLPISETPLEYSIWLTYAPFAADLVNTETMEGMLILDTLQELTNIHFKVTAANGVAEQDNFNLMIAAGDYCDILSSMSFYNTGLEGAVEEGILQDLADILPEQCPTYWSYLSANNDALMRAYTDSGYMPTIFGLYPEEGQEAIGMVIRQDWLEEFRMGVPATYNELYAYLEMSKAVKDAMFDLPRTDGLIWDLAYGENVEIGGFEVVDGKVEYGQAQNGFKEYLRFMHRLYQNQIISQDFFSDTAADLSSTARLNFAGGLNSLVQISASNTVDVLTNATENIPMAVLPYISVSGTVENHVGSNTLVGITKDDDPWAFSTECDNIEPLLEMVEFLYSDEGYMLTNYGIEDITYTLDTNGDPQYTDLIIHNPDGLSYFFASYIYVTNPASSNFPYINDLRKTFYDFNDNQWEVFDGLKSLSDCTYNYPAYAVMTTAEAANYAAIDSEISTYADSRILEFITGAADIDAEFDAYVDTLYSMGLQDMVDIKQAAYDRAVERAAALGIS